MAKYKRYQKLQKYYLGVPVEPAEYKEGELIDTKVYNSIEECENDTTIDIEINAGTDLNLRILQTDCESVRFETNVPMYLKSKSANWIGYTSESIASTYYDFYIETDEPNVWGLDRECIIILCDTQNYNTKDANWIKLYITNSGHIVDLSDYRLYIIRIESYTSTPNDNGASYSEHVNLYHATNLLCDPNYIPDSGSQMTYNNWVSTSDRLFLRQNGFTVTPLGEIDGLYHYTVEDAGTSFSLLSSVVYSHFIDLSNITDLKGMFRHSIEYIGGNFTGWNTSNVTNMVEMFANCEKVTTLDLSSFNTSKVTTMGGMFGNCKNLKNLNISSFNTSNVTDMGQMFDGCHSFTTFDLSHFDTSKVTNMGGMFRDCSSLTTLNLSSFDTRNVLGVGRMFYGCTSLKELNISGWDLTKAYNKNHTYQMFVNCIRLQTIYAYNCNETTIEYLNEELFRAGLTDQVTIITQ